MDIQVGDSLIMKKKHPCGSDKWLCLRTGIDIRIKCEGCGHIVMESREKIEKNIKKVIKNTNECL